MGLVFLWWVAAPFEQRFGAKTTGVVSLLSVVAAGLGTSLASLVIPMAPYQFGVNPLILALIGGFAAILPPNRPLSFFGVLSFKPKALIGFIVAISALFALLNENYAGFVGDLAAIGIGILYMRRRMLGARKPAKKPKRKNGLHGFKVIEGGGDKPKYLN